MTPSQSRNSAHRVRRPSTGHGRVQPGTQMSSQIVRQLTRREATDRLFTSRFTLACLAAASRSQSHASPVALKSP